MKRVFTILILMLAFVVEGQSQTGLQIAELFNGSYKRKDNASGERQSVGTIQTESIP